MGRGDRDRAEAKSSQKLFEVARSGPAGKKLFYRLRLGSFPAGVHGVNKGRHCPRPESVPATAELGAGYLFFLTFGRTVRSFS